ncbi:MAG: OsmC family protein [Dehalococcoidales bacterium]|nr:OsmC family protein [Dehalococcoidales bacterium]
MAKRNNVNVDAVQKMAEGIQADPAKGKRTNRIEGIWNLAEGKPQFSSEISFEGGKLLVEADQPTFLGGGGTRPGPMHYALFGLASCFTATFATMAAMHGVALQEVRTSAEFELNFAKVFGVADLPIVEEVRVALAVKSEASRDKIEEVMKLAEERCPASFCLTNPIRLTAKLAK